MRHPSTTHWQIPASDRPNLRELCARPERYEHHLVVVATIGDVQLEVATASEPLYFGHVNISDEYALALPCGDPLVDGFPNMRTFLADATTNEDIGRYNHKVGDLVLHPLGALHWPGRLRAPYTPFAFPPGTRRTGLSLVYCASRPTASTLVPLSGEGAKAYADPAPPMAICSVAAHLGLAARIGDTTLSIERGRIAPPRGGWVVDLETCDLHRLAPGESLELARAVVFSSELREPDPWPPAWRALPPPPFAPFEGASAGVPPIELAAFVANVPHYWLARTLFRVALHQMRLGYVETYEGFYVDDGAGHGDVRLGLRGGGSIAIERHAAQSVLEQLYRSVAPRGYVEHI